MENVILNDEEDYRVLLKSIRDSVYVLNKEWRHILVNDAAESSTGIPKDKLLGSKLTELFPGVENTPFLNTLLKTDVRAGMKYMSILYQKEYCVFLAILPNGKSQKRNAKNCNND